jgi:tRNA nucleotidyltransferase/poly(A) polymerase
VLFDIETNTWNSLKKHVALVQNVAKERIKEEIKKVFSV